VTLDSGLKDLLRAFMLMPVARLAVGSSGAREGGGKGSQLLLDRPAFHNWQTLPELLAPGAWPSPATMPSVMLFPRDAICWKATTAQEAYLPAMEWARSLYRTYRTPLCSCREASRMEAYLGRAIGVSDLRPGTPRWRGRLLGSELLWALTR
jgi:hypothetical protein